MDFLKMAANLVKYLTLADVVANRALLLWRTIQEFAAARREKKGQE